VKNNRWIAMMCTLVLVGGIVAGCGAATPKDQVQPTKTAEDTTPLQLTIGFQQVGDIPNKGNEFEQAVEKYTNTKLDIQWIPAAAINEKINIMIASNELPKILKVNYVPTVISSMQQGLFWEVGPYLKDYKNLNAQNAQYYQNISVDGKIYGIPQFREIGRPAIVYRNDWMDTLGLKMPKTLDDWYNVLKALTLNDPDKNGKNDTFGTVLYKKYNEDFQPPLTRIAVTQGAPNRWGVDNGKFTPEFMTKEYVDVMKLFRRLFAEKLINQDFPVLDKTEMEKMLESGKIGFRLNGVATNAVNHQDRLGKTVPNATLEIANFEGPKGIRIAGEPGNNGILVIPKSSVKTEAEMKRILAFFDKIMDPTMSLLQRRGIEGKHFTTLPDGKTQYTDLTAFNREIKPYRDNLLNLESYNTPLIKDTPLGEKGYRMEWEGLKSSVPNPALYLSSAIYSDRGNELDQMIWDAQTKYIMNKIDDAGWQSEVDKWRKAGGDQLIKEYGESYAKINVKK
jgi:putative aldouronate transport system substrate-binding protein